MGTGSPIRASLCVVLLLAASCGDGSSPATSSSTSPVDPDLDDDGLDGEETPDIVAGQILFVNHCVVELTLLSDRAPLATLEPTRGRYRLAISPLPVGSPNIIQPFPNVTDAQCPAAYCDGWTALGGVPGKTQREGWMWQGDNVTYAAYCNPNLSGRNICAMQKNCCGSGMVQDGTFGTTWEFTPGHGGGNDFVDLSTNFGTGPRTPPSLCGPGVNPDNCVTKAANIFFNVPVRWSSSSDCSCTTNGTMVASRQCLEADCPDAYQYPTDDKQCACSASPSRGYLVEFCPSGSSMPDPPVRTE